METPMPTRPAPGSASSSQPRFRVTCALIPLGEGETPRVLALAAASKTRSWTQQGTSLDQNWGGHEIQTPARTNQAPAKSRVTKA